MARYQLVEYGEDEDSGCMPSVIVLGLMIGGIWLMRLQVRRHRV
jgi:hypothetical protein